MIPITRLAIFSILCLFGCSENKELSLEHQTYEFIFSELLEETAKEILIEKAHCYGEAEGKSIDELLSDYAELEKFPRSLLERFAETSSSQEKISWQPMAIPARFVALNERERIGGIEFWVDFQDEFPRSEGYYSVSRAILDKTGNEAVVLYSYHCAVLCGAHDTLLYLKKDAAGWKLISGTRLWIS